MNKKIFGKILSLSIVIPLFLYLAGIIAQFIINISRWKAAGSDVNTSPGFPSFHFLDSITSLLNFPEGLIALGVVGIGVLFLCVHSLGLQFGGQISDRERNFTISGSGSYGTAAFMSEREAKNCFDITTCANTKQDILGITPSGKVFTLPEKTRLNSNLAVCGASGTGKSRSVSRNLILQAARRNESIIVTDCKSELYDSIR